MPDTLKSKLIGPIREDLVKEALENYQKSTITKEFDFKGTLDIAKSSGKNTSWRSLRDVDFEDKKDYLIIFELIIRFLTDFLQSNRYFKTKYETHNLFRAEVQYRLLSSFLYQIPNLSDELKKNGICPSSKFISDVQKICLGFS